jgi:hypothetical protein
MNYPMTSDNLAAALEDAIANLGKGYTVDHIHTDKGTAAIRVYDADRSLYNVEISTNPGTAYALTKERVHAQLVRWLATPFVEALIKPFGASPEKAKQIAAKIGSRITREERLRLEFENLLAEWENMKTPPKKASIPLGRGWSIALRRDEVFPDDPGQGTPTMVCGPFGASSTLGVASDMGIVENRQGAAYDIPQHVLDALNIAEEYADAYVEVVTNWMKKNA